MEYDPLTRRVNYSENDRCDMVDCFCRQAFVQSFQSKSVGSHISELPTTIPASDSHFYDILTLAVTTHCLRLRVAAPPTDIEKGNDFEKIQTRLFRCIERAVFCCNDVLFDRNRRNTDNLQIS